MNNRKANFWASSCLRKKGLKLEWAEDVIKRAKAEGNYLRAYLCKECLRYHVTSKPEKKS
jgi:hypothetical protein